MRISDWSSDVCSSDLLRLCDHSLHIFDKAAVHLMRGDRCADAVDMSGDHEERFPTGTAFSPPNANLLDAGVSKLNWAGSSTSGNSQSGSGSMRLSTEGVTPAANTFIPSKNSEAPQAP